MDVSGGSGHPRSGNDESARPQSGPTTPAADGAQPDPAAPTTPGTPGPEPQGPTDNQDPGRNDDNQHPDPTPPPQSPPRPPPTTPAANPAATARADPGGHRSAGPNPAEGS